MAEGFACLGEADFNDVYIYCESVKANWLTLATYLRVYRPTVQTIQSRGLDPATCLHEVLSAWLKRSSLDQPKPSWRSLCDALAGMGEVALSERIQREHRCACGLCIVRATPVSMAVQQENAVDAAEKLKKVFEELLEFLATEIRKIDIDVLRLQISNHFQKEEISDEIENHLTKIEDYDKPNAVLNYFCRHRFIGYINYSLVKVFQKIAKSPLLNKRIEEYEKDYHCFLQLSLQHVYNAFQQCPDLRPDYPAGIPKFSIHLESEWDGKSVFTLKEFLKQCCNNSDCIDQLMIAKISRNCIIITFAVLPLITRTVLQYLTNDDVISTLKKEGITVYISKQLMKYQRKTTKRKEKMTAYSTATEKVDAKQELQDRFSDFLLIEPSTTSSTVDSGYGRLVKYQQKTTEEKGTMTADLEILVGTEGGDQQGATAVDVYELYRASMNGDSDLVNLLLSCGTKVDIKGNGGQTPLYVASRNGYSNIVKILLSHRATVNIKDNRGWTPLHIASAYGHSDVVNILLSYKAKMDTKDNQGRTPLHEAADYNKGNVVGILLSHGATVNVVDKNLQTPLHRCLLNSSYDNVDATLGLLISRGADLYQEDKFKQSPVLIATVLGKEHLLLRHGVSEDTIAKYRLPQGWKVDYSDEIEYTNAVTGKQLSTHPLFQ